MLIGYARFSKADGTRLLDLQRAARLDAGVDEERIYEDRASGRNLKHLVTTVEELYGRGIGLRVLARAGAEIDTTTANGRLVFGIFVALAEFERELIAERTRGASPRPAPGDAWAAGPASRTWPRCAWRCTPWQIETPLSKTW